MLYQYHPAALGKPGEMPDGPTRPIFPDPAANEVSISAGMIAVPDPAVDSGMMLAHGGCKAYIKWRKGEVSIGFHCSEHAENDSTESMLADNFDSFDGIQLDAFV